MEFLQLRYFKTAARLENISHAAVYHGVPQPAMSKTISRLEKELGCPLFDRIGNRLKLNENGRIFLSYTEKILNCHDDAISELGKFGTVKGEIKLLVLENRRIVTDCIAEFTKKFPNVTFNILHSYPKSYSYDFDICISAFSPNIDGLIKRELVNEELRLVVSASSELAKRKSVEFSELAEKNFILMPESNSINKITVSECILNGFTPNISIVCDDPSTIRKYTAMGLGVTVAPMISWKNLFGDDVSFIPIKKGTGILSRTTYMFLHGDRYISPAVETFGKMLSDRFSEEK